MDLFIKKNGFIQRVSKKFTMTSSPCILGFKYSFKKILEKKKFIELIKKYEYFLNKKRYEFSDRKKREILKILNSTQNKKSEFIKLKKKFIQNLINDRLDFVIRNYLILSKMIDKPKIYSQFAGFRSNEISNFLNKIINLKNISSYAEIGCPLWGNYNHFKKPWIKQYFINIDEINFWKAKNCLKYLSKRVKIKNKLNKNKIDFVGIYNFLDHLENPLKLFNKDLKNVENLAIICEDINLSKKIDCQHFSSWSHKSLLFLSKKIGYTIIDKPFRLSNSIYKLYVLKKY